MHEGLLRIKVPRHHGCDGCFYNNGEKCMMGVPITSRKCTSVHYESKHEVIWVTEDQYLIHRLRHGREQIVD